MDVLLVLFFEQDMKGDHRVAGWHRGISYVFSFPCFSQATRPGRETFVLPYSWEVCAASARAEVVLRTPLTLVFQNLVSLGKLGVGGGNRKSRESGMTLKQRVCGSKRKKERCPKEKEIKTIYEVVETFAMWCLRDVAWP